MNFVSIFTCTFGLLRLGCADFAPALPFAAKTTSSRPVSLASPTNPSFSTRELWVPIEAQPTRQDLPLKHSLPRMDHKTLQGVLLLPLGEGMFAMQGLVARHELLRLQPSL